MIMSESEALQNYQPWRGNPPDEYGTPPTVFRRYDDVLHFTKDVCASPRNHKVRSYWTKRDNAIIQNWSPYRCWLNPPYSRQLGIWIEKATMEAAKGTLICGLFPKWTGRKWFRMCEETGYIIFLDGRMSFVGAGGNSRWESMVVLWNATDAEIAQLNERQMRVGFASHVMK
jgi:phage N-6-adenine-methyltransferase